MISDLSNEVQAAIIMSASQASIEYANIKVDSKKGKKNFNTLYTEAFEKNYNKLVSIVTKPEETTIPS
jgi:hypothetical protein